MSRIARQTQSDTGKVIDGHAEKRGVDLCGVRGLHKLRPGQSVSSESTGDREVCLVFVSGKGRVRRAR